MVGWIILGIFVLFLLVIVIRTLLFRPRKEVLPEPLRVDVDESRIVSDMRELIRVKTVSYLDKSLEDPAAFAEFPELLKRLYPRIHATMKQERIGEKGLLYHWAGRSDERPGVLMAHYDVVPVQESTWRHPPFAGEIHDDALWGRGTLDTKCTLLGVMEAAEHLLAEGYVPENDLYFAFGGDEEIFGEAAPAIVEELQKRGVKPFFVLDEGGAVVENVFPGVTAPCALIGLAEKGIANILLESKSSGGHASTPPVHTAVGIVASAVTRVEKHPFPFRLTPAVRQMFDILGRRSGFLYRMIFANLWCFSPVFNLLCKKSGGELNAMVRTTCAFTQMSGSPAFNVLPPKAVVGANLRLIGDETTESARAYVEKIVRDPRVSVTVANGNNPSECSEASGEAWAQLSEAIHQTWDGVIVSPYLMMAGSDSRHYSPICPHVYRFSPVAMSLEERKTIHADDERIPLTKLCDIVRFYVRLMRKI